jgi:hypothetical protein
MGDQATYICITRMRHSTQPHSIGPDTILSYLLLLSTLNVSTFTVLFHTRMA